MKKRMAALLTGVMIVSAVFGGCGKKEEAKERETVSLSVWGSVETQDLLKEMTKDFAKHYEKEAKITITVGAEPEDTLADNLVKNPDWAADVFAFADDQMGSLRNADVLLPITLNKEQIIENCGGADTQIIQAASEGDTLYAYPMTADNGYFMFYHAGYFSEEDVKSFDRMLEAAESAGKFVAMDYSSGWYLYSFFGGAGLSLSATEDGTGNLCNFNATDTKYTGVQVAEAMLSIASKKGFLNTDDNGFTAGVQDGTVIAGVNGPWNAQTVKAAWGEDYRAAKLPTYTLNGEQVQMASFIGYKLIGVNRHTDEPEWAMRLAEWICNEENQTKRYELTGECPANIKAASSEQVQSSQTVKAMREQQPYAVQQRVASCYWTPATVFGTVIASGNPDNRDLQQILDEFAQAAAKDSGDSTGTE